ncbi:hypothetical protein BDY19DRAFT_913305 [Irpex rosettiformis]|uniref:Uncharacterized protein n=1 Tax=Irpex rosettiformis TaxID=378272 RepID=A0ACB8UKE1_9APHY|nr:hypothetical protein BDY19DRAFT_913305 [Irpex rosettiformis]
MVNVAGLTYCVLARFLLLVSSRLVSITIRVLYFIVLLIVPRLPASSNVPLTRPHHFVILHPHPSKFRNVLPSLLTSLASFAFHILLLLFDSLPSWKYS